MKWGDLPRVLNKKLRIERVPGSKHERLSVFCDDKVVGTALISHGSGEMRSREIGNVARSLGLNERQFRDLIACNISGEEYCELVDC